MPDDIYAGFAQRLPARVARVHDAVRAAETKPTSALVRRARREAHKLAGTAGSYGHYCVSTAARAIERSLEPAQPAWADVQAAVAALHAAVNSDSQDAPIPAHIPDGAPHASRRQRRSVPRVLIVDSDETARDDIAGLLERQLVDAVCTGFADARGLAGQGDWDALIVDTASMANSEGRDPFAVARELRALAGGNTVPLALMSPRETLDQRIAAAHAGATLFLPKPLSLGGLGDAIATLWAQTRAQRPRVLAVDDDPDFLDHLRDVLTRDGTDVCALTDPKEIVRALREHRPDALLLDFDMPDYAGTELCAMLRGSREYRHLPILLITSRQGAEFRQAAFEAGADDYILKPVVPMELRARLRARIERASMLRAAAETDTLTGLPLRRVFVAGLEMRLSEAIRRNTSLAVCLLDLDHFKLINDTHGHLAGDRVLAELGALLAARFRGEDLRCRWGGEEFALAFPGENADTIVRVMDAVLHEFSSRDFSADDGARFQVSFSAGVSQARRDGATVDALIRAADRRLYAAKHSGRAQVAAASPATGPHPFIPPSRPSPPTVE